MTHDITYASLEESVNADKYSRLNMKVAGNRTLSFGSENPETKIWSIDFVITIYISEEDIFIFTSGLYQLSCGGSCGAP